MDILLGNDSDDSLYSLLNGGNVSNVEIFFKADNIDGWDLTSLAKLETLVNIYVSEDGDEVSLSNPTEEPGIGWDLSNGDGIVPPDGNGITTLTFNGLYSGEPFTLTIETTLQAEVDQAANEIVLSHS